MSTFTLVILPILNPITAQEYNNQEYIKTERKRTPRKKEEEKERGRRQRIEEEIIHSYIPPIFIQESRTSQETRCQHHHIPAKPKQSKDIIDRAIITKYQAIYYI